MSVCVCSMLILLIGCFNKESIYIDKVIRYWANWMILSIGIKLDVVGIENLCRKDRYVFMCNHGSAADILVCLTSLPFNIKGADPSGQFI